MRIVLFQGKDRGTVGFNFRLIWRDTPPKAEKEEGEISNGVNNVNIGETKSEDGVKTEAKDAKVVENGDLPRAPTPVLHSYS